MNYQARSASLPIHTHLPAGPDVLPRQKPRARTSSQLIRARVPPFLLLAAVLSAALPINEAFIVAATIGSIVGAWMGYVLLFQLKQFRLSWILADGLLLGYAGGTVNTAARLTYDGTSAAEYFGRSQHDLSMALALVFCVASVLVFLGGLLERPIRIDIAKLKSLDFAVVWFGLLLVAGAFLTGGIGFMGVTSTSEHRVSSIGSIAGTLAPVLPALTILLQAKCRNWLSRLASWAILAASLATLAPQGRRVLIYGIVLLVLAFSLRGKVPAGIWKKAIFVVAALPLLYFGNTFFYALRVANWQAGGRSNHKLGLQQLTSRASHFIGSGRNSNFDGQIQRNLRDRTFILRYFSDVWAASQRHQLLQGKALAFCFQTTIPSALFAGKAKINHIEMEENVTNPQLGLVATDEANSILTTGAADFGLFGVFIYPIAAALLLSSFLRLATRKSAEVVKVVAFLALAYTLWQAEMGTAVDLGLCRNLLILWIPLTMLSAWHAFVERDPKRRQLRLNQRNPSPQRAAGTRSKYRNPNDRVPPAFVPTLVDPTAGMIPKLNHRQ